MLIHVKLSTTLRDAVPHYDPAAGLTVHIESPATAAQLAAELGLPAEEIKIVMRNGRHSDMDAPLDDNDRVAFFPAVGGG